MEFLHDYLCPSPKARDVISFGMEDMLFTVVSDSEDFPAQRPGSVRARAIKWPDEPFDSQSSKLDVHLIWHLRFLCRVAAFRWTLSSAADILLCTILALHATKHLSARLITISFNSIFALSWNK